MSSSEELYHHGILGMKWGVRRYQNKDGTLTQKGKKRYSDVTELKSKKTGEKLYVAQRQVKQGDSERNFDVIQNGRKIGNAWLEDQGIICTLTGLI